MFVTRSARRAGGATAILHALEVRAIALGHRVLRLETGCRQVPAIALYEASGYRRIAPFGAYADDPTSVCFEKRLDAMPPDGRRRRRSATGAAVPSPAAAFARRPKPPREDGSRSPLDGRAPSAAPHPT